MRFRPRRRVVEPAFVELHINPSVLRDEWVGGDLKLRQTKRSRGVRNHLAVCPRCQALADQMETASLPPVRGKDAQIPVWDR